MLFANQAATVEELRRGNRPLPVYLGDPRSWAAVLGSAESAMLQALHTQLLLPMTRGNELLGFMSLGPKISDPPYSSADAHLLHAVASQTALAVENTRLTSAIASETAEREVMNRELAIAREVQQRLFPQSYPEIPGVAYFGTCRPAQQVGGDYYDFLELPRHALGLAIGDVSGKGIPASLLMATLQASLRGQVVSGAASIDRVMENINKLVHAASSVNRYATFFYAQYEPDLSRLTYVNAGHNPPMLLRQNGSGTEVIRLEAGGPPVGLFAKSAYQSSWLELQGGDLLVLFTDGISEAMNTADEEWGEDRLLESIKKSHEDTPNEMVDAIFQAADEFTLDAPQHDDMTIVTLRVQSPI
jgi:sigma-B regulation protein RsbU (phosphoserine phosphatase)